MIKNRIIVLLVVAGVILTLVLRTCTGPEARGQALYESNCASCHMKDGSGLAKVIPPLKNADYLEKNKDQFACIIHNGLYDTIVVNGITYTTPMQSMPTLAAAQIANIANYVYSEFSNSKQEITLSEVESQLEKCR